jgi:hypothetical protein
MQTLSLSAYLWHLLSALLPAWFMAAWLLAMGQLCFGRTGRARMRPLKRWFTLGLAGSVVVLGFIAWTGQDGKMAMYGSLLLVLSLLEYALGPASQR